VKYILRSLYTALAMFFWLGVFSVTADTVIVVALSMTATRCHTVSFGCQPRFTEILLKVKNKHV